MVQFSQRTQREPTTGERFSQAFANIGQEGTRTLADHYLNKYKDQQETEAIRRLTGVDTEGLSPKARESVAKELLKGLGTKGKQTSKDLSGLSTYISKELKARGRSSLASDPRYLQAFRQRAAELVEAGYEPHEAFDAVLSEMSNSKKKDNFGPPREENEDLGPSQRRADEGKFLGGYLGGAYETAKRNPEQLLKELPVAGLKSAQGLTELSDPIGVKNKITSDISRLLQQREGAETPEGVSGGLWGLKAREKGTPRGPGLNAAELLGSATRRNLSPEDQEGAERIAEAESVLVDLFGPKAIGIIGKLLGGSKAAKVAPKVASIPKPKIPSAERELKSLTGRVSPNAVESATEMRVSRAAPERKIFNTKEAIKTRETQVKAYPKYEAEIAQDAAERAERIAKREPKTERGLQSRAARVAEAEKKWPMAQESYNKAAGRVRALESEISSLKGSSKQSANQILELAKKDLEDATFQLKQSFENLKGVNVREGLPEMRDAARNKISEIQSAIEAGEDYKLAKADYNPELVARAKAIAKKKAIPKTRESDFYTQVHDAYATEYKNRIAQLEQEIKQLPRSMQGLSRGRELQLEKNVLDKMVANAEAEKTIQNRRFALREMSERKKAQERFSSLKKQEANPKVQKAAQEKMWKERIQEIKSESGRAKVAEEVTEEAAKSARTPEQADKIRSEGPRLRDALDEVAKKQEKISDGFKSSRSSRKAKNFGEKIMEDFKELADSFKKGKFEFLKTKIGIDTMVGMGTAIFDDLLKEFEVPITGSSVIAAVQGGVRRGSYRTISNQLTKWALKEFHIENAARAYRDHNEEKLEEFSPSVKKKARERAFG